METTQRPENCMTLIKVLFVALFIGSIVFLTFYDGTSWFPPFAALLYILTSVLTVICLLCGFLKANGYDTKTDADSGHAAIESKYRIGIFFIVVSVSLVVIYILSHVVATLVDFDASDEDVANFYTAFIALCTTFVVGFQIYNSLDLNKKIDKLDADKKSLEEELKKLKEVTKESEYFNAYSIGTIRYNEAGMNIKPSAEVGLRYCWNAFRAYANALKLAAEGGHEFCEAWDSFGATKMFACLAALEVIHEKRKYGKDDGGKDEIMPSYDDRKRYVKEISMHMDSADISVKNSKYIAQSYANNFEELVQYWKDFKEKYYPQIS